MTRPSSAVTPSGTGASEPTALAEQRPRERLAALGPEALGDAELVALLLRTGSRGADAVSLSRRLLSGCDGLRGMARSAEGEFRRFPGMGPGKTASLIAAFEISRRLAAHRLAAGDSIRSPEDVHRHFYPRLRDHLRECFVAVLLDGRHRVIREVLISQGTLTASLVHPREVFRPALREAAAALILVHNHPSGDPRPSREDRDVTHRLVQAGEVLGVRVLDHVVVAERGYHSFSEAGELDAGFPDPSQPPRPQP